MSSYDAVLTLAKSHGFSNFTQLQEEAFQNERVYAPQSDLFVIGETSSGKTLIPLLLYEAALLTAEENGVTTPRMLFVVPYLALAAQKLEEIRDFFKNRDMSIVQSTGEFRKDDELVRKGNVDISVIITENVFRYEASETGFLSKYDYIVLDEVGLVSDSARGVRLDFILAWAMRQRTQNTASKVIALGTPFFDWGEYIRSYGFLEIRASKRPVLLEKIDITYEKGAQSLHITRLEGNCSFLYCSKLWGKKQLEKMKKFYSVPTSYCKNAPDERCPLEESCRQVPSKLCTHTGKPCSERILFVEGTTSYFNEMLLIICREHLKKGHQILLFLNDRERVRSLCSMLYENLSEYLPNVPSAEECKQQILAECGLEAEDTFGIMEYEESNGHQTKQKELFRAFRSGISFHCASLPNEMRTYVEKKLLDSREMRIVCSTETLAFGVNSTVDVVIIADLNKYDGSDHRQLSMNEYQNYAGRAGRLRHGVDAGAIKGYVYTLVRESENDLWTRMNKEKEAPECLRSLFFENQQRYMPFFLLNLLPTESADGLSDEALTEMVRQIPGDELISDEELKEHLRNSLQFLYDQNLLSKVRSHGLGRHQSGRGLCYCLTENGKRLRGYILSCEDYLSLLDALEEYIGSNVFIDGDRIKFLYRLLNTKHAEKGLNNVFSKSTTRLSLNELKEYVRTHVTDANHDTEWLDGCTDERILSLLAALLAWCDGESPHMLYRHFGIHYTLLSKMAEQIAYLVEISATALPSRMERIWAERGEKYERCSISYDTFLAGCAGKNANVHDLYTSIFFGINTKICGELLAFAQKEAETTGTQDPIDELSLGALDPISARYLRRIVIRYRFFANPPKIDAGNVEARNNFREKERRYKQDVEGFSSHVRAFFKHKFPTIF